DEEARFAVDDLVGNPAAPGGNDGQRHRGGFSNRNAKTFAPSAGVSERVLNENIALTEAATDIGGAEGAEETHVGRKAEARDERLEIRTLVTLADEGEIRVDSLFANEGHRANGFFDAFPRHEARDRQNVQPPAGRFCPGGCEERGGNAARDQVYPIL